MLGDTEGTSCHSHHKRRNVIVGEVYRFDRSSFVTIGILKLKCSWKMAPEGFSVVVED